MSSTGAVLRVEEQSNWLDSFHLQIRFNSYTRGAARKSLALQRQNSCDGKVISETGETNKSNDKSKAVLCNRPPKGKDNPNRATGWLVSLANPTWRRNSLRRLNVASKWSRKAITKRLFSIYLKRVISSDFSDHRPCRISACYCELSYSKQHVCVG